MISVVYIDVVQKENVRLFETNQGSNKMKGEKNMKKYIVILLCLVMLLGLMTACASPSPSASAENPATVPGESSATYVIKLGHACSAKHPYNQGAMRFKEIVEEKTNGAITVELYPDSTLGAERDLIEGLQLGSVEMGIVSTAPLSSYTDQFLVFDLPYIFTSKEQARGVVDSEIGQRMFDAMAETSGIIGLAYYENGFRNFTNAKFAIQSPEDLKGLKIRVMENQIMMATITACEGDPTPMAFNELYTALQQGTIDGQENPISQIYDKKMYEVQKYITMSGHFYAPAPLLISNSFWESLPAEYQVILQNAAYESRDYMRGRNEAEEAEQIREMVEEHGCEVVYDVDIAAWQEAMHPVYSQYVGDGKSISQELVDSIVKFQP